MDHAVVHADEDLVGGDGVAEEWGKGVGVGLLGGFDTEVDDGVEEGFDLRGGDLRDAAFKDEGDAGAGGLLDGLLSKGVVVNGDMREEAVFGVGAAVEIDNDAIGLEGERGDHDTVAGSGGLALLVDHALVLLGAGGDGAVGAEGEASAHGEGTVGEALFGFEVAEEIAAAALGERGAGEIDFRVPEFSGDAVGGGFFSDHKDLRGRERGEGRQGGRKESPSVRTQGHGGTSNVRLDCSI